VTARRGSRTGERGFTLVEMLVCLALLALIGTVMGIVFSVGLRAIVAPGASKDRLAASSDAIAVQQLLSTDVNRASCIAVAPASGGSLNPYGSCAAETSPFQGDCSDSASGSGSDSDSGSGSGSGTALLCLEWPDLTTATQCDVAVYTLGSQQVTRTAWLGAASAGSVSYPVTVAPSAPVVVTPTATPAAPSAPGFAWPVELEITVTSADAQLINPPSLSLDLQPLATAVWPTDPVSDASTGPC
jgi:prepilin-type N-terminal cleavage/methylation domain-containing protein